MPKDDANTPLLKALLRKQHQQSFERSVDDEMLKQGEKILDKYSPKKDVTRGYFHIAFWILAAIAVIHFTDFFVALRFDTRINRVYLIIGLSLIGLSVAIGVWMILYYHYYKGIANYERHQPFAVPMSVVAFLAGITILCVGLWPVWSVLTPFILITIFMGTIFSLSMLPI